MLSCLSGWGLEETECGYVTSPDLTTDLQTDFLGIPSWASQASTATSQFESLSLSLSSCESLSASAVLQLQYETLTV